MFEIVRTFERKCQSKDDVGRHALLEQVSQALLAVRTSFVREICESDSDASAILASDLAATNTSPSPSTRTSTSLVAALVAAADESKSASRLVLQLAATSEQLLASVAEAMLQVPARNSDDRSLLAFTLLHSLVATSHSDSLDDASDDSLAERALLLALKNAKLDLPNEPFALATSRIVKTIACSTPTGLNDIVQFLFADLHSRSHSRLLSIFVSCAHSLGQAVLDLFKTRVETGINDLDRLSTLFGLSCLFLLDKWNIQAGGTKEFYHIWLARTLNSTTRRSIQFIASLFQSTYLSCPSDFNCATLLAVRNLPAFKQLVSDIKLHLADVSDLDQSKLVEVGIVDGKRLAFSRFMDEFTANGEKAVPKSLFMEILVNDAWYKTQFLPRLMKRVNETTDTQWKQQQTLFDFLRKAGRVPASFLATHAATLAENLQTGDKPISLTDLSDLKTRLETAIQLYAELDESVDEAFEQDCLEGIKTLFRQIHALFKVPASHLDFCLQIDKFGDFECQNLFCNTATIAVVDSLLNSIRLFGSGHKKEDRISRVVQAIATLLQSCLPTLVLRLFSLFYGVAKLSDDQAAVLARVLFHIGVWLSSSHFHHHASNKEEDKAYPTAYLFLIRYTLVDCPIHMDTAVTTFLQIVETRPWNDQHSSDWKKHEIQVLTSLTDFVPHLKKRVGIIRDRRNGVLRSIAYNDASEWTVWEVTCSRDSGMTTFSRARYIKRIVTQFLSNGECVAQWSAVIKGVCDGLLWIETRGWENSCDREGAVLICNALTEAWLCAEEEMKKTWSPGLAFKFLGVDRFRIFFNVMYMLPGQCLWSVGAKVSEDTRFWEDRFCECEGVLGWNILEDASCLLLEGLLASRKGTEPLELITNAPAVTSSWLASSKFAWEEHTSLSQVIPLEGIYGLLTKSLPNLLPPSIVAKAVIIRYIMECDSTIESKILEITSKDAMGVDGCLTRDYILDSVKALLKMLHRVTEEGVIEQREVEITKEIQKLSTLL